MRTDTQFYSDLSNGKTINVNGKPMPLAIYNLICSKRDLGLWKAGITIHRHWKVTPVKKYYGFKGTNRASLYAQACNLLEECNEILLIKRKEK